MPFYLFFGTSIWYLKIKIKDTVRFNLRSYRRLDDEANTLPHSQGCFLVSIWSHCFGHVKKYGIYWTIISVMSEQFSIHLVKKWRRENEKVESSWTSVSQTADAKSTPSLSSDLHFSVIKNRPHSWPLIRSKYVRKGSK